MESAHITVLGARGSIPVSGPQYTRYGGNTTCFAIVVDQEVVALIDAGTGLVDAARHGLTLARSVAIYLTHYHWDHIQGLSMMEQMWRGSCDICVWGKDDPASILERAISPPLFPVSIADVPTIRFAAADGPIAVSGITVTPFRVHHPQGALGYRIDGPERSVAIATDHEAGTAIDDDVAAAVMGVDTLIHDAQYLPGEIEAHRGWGHSSYEDAVLVANTGNVSELILTSHDPRRSDDAIDAMVASAGALFLDTKAARPGMEISL